MKPNGDAKPRRQFPAETRLHILKGGRTTTLTISQVCDQYQISPTPFCQWERQADRVTLQELLRGRKKLRPTEEALLVEVQRLHKVLAESSSENLQIKRGTGDNVRSALPGGRESRYHGLAPACAGTVPRAQTTDLPADLRLPKATYYRWLERAAGGQLVGRVAVPQRQAPPCRLKSASCQILLTAIRCLVSGRHGQNTVYHRWPMGRQHRITDPMCRLAVDSVVPPS